ncbi:hypothetical protein HSB1_06130 [Halogranum salarium B-1]|uniref:Uncharacterized protein n=1 Tax=Halogranum salarium B-1 TaxID=1210908 RepID=J3F0G1_9EURY|nr:hypothetical protein HSB1_06130 [Halogranum salarium B-1]
MSRLRNLAGDRCNPPVVITPKFYENQQGSAATGDVLVIDIDPRREVPHAVVSGRNNEQRTYYIRTADESRVISDSEELQQLFSGSIDPTFEHWTRMWYIHQMWTYEPIKTMPRPDSWTDFNNILNELSDEDRELLADDETKQADDGSRVGELSAIDDENKGTRLIRELVPILLLYSVSRTPTDFWARQNVSTSDEAEAYRQRASTIGRSDIEFENKPQAINELSIDLDELLNRYSLEMVVPYRTTASIQFPTEWDTPARLRFEVADLLDLCISVRSPGHPSEVMGPPPSYPRKIDGEVYSQGFDIQLFADFAFPDVADPNIRIHRKFVSGWKSFIDGKWNWNTFVEDYPRREVYDIHDRVETIEEKLNTLLDADDC